MLERTWSGAFSPHTRRAGTGVIVYAPLARDVLTDKYLDGSTPPGSRAAELPAIARRRKQSLAFTPDELSETDTLTQARADQARRSPLATIGLPASLRALRQRTLLNVRFCLLNPPNDPSTDMHRRHVARK